MVCSDARALQVLVPPAASRVSIKSVGMPLTCVDLSISSARDRMNLTREINTSIHSAGASDSELARDSLTCRIANWCPYERCNTILHCGRLYLKPSPADQFR